MRNWQRWMLTLVLGFMGGIVTAATADKGQLTVRNYVLSGVIGMGPAIAALQMTLNKDEQTVPPK